MNDKSSGSYYNGLLNTKAMVESIFTPRRAVPVLVIPNLTHACLPTSPKAVERFLAAQIVTAKAHSQRNCTEKETASRITGEAFAVGIPASMCFDAVQSAKEFVAALRWYIAKKLTPLDRSIITSRDPNHPAPQVPSWLANEIENIPETEQTNADAMFKWFISQYPYTNWTVEQGLRPEFLADRTQTLLQYFCAMCRRGHANENFVRRISAEARKVFNVNVVLQVGVISYIWDMWSEFFDETEARSFFEDWSNWFPGLTSDIFNYAIQQAAWAGMTSYVCVIQAMRDFPDFYWSQLREWHTDEFTNFAGAVSTVGNDQYYGYKADLGPAQHTKFASIAYAAIQLLIRVGRQNTLKGYKGLNNNRINRIRIDGLINHFITTGKNATQYPEMAAFIAQLPTVGSVIGPEFPGQH